MINNASSAPVGESSYLELSSRISVARVSQSGRQIHEWAILKVENGCHLVATVKSLTSPPVEQEMHGAT